MPTDFPIQLVAIDLDGTLLNDAKQVSDCTIGALRCLPARGVRTVIASARPPRSVRHIYQSLGLDTLQINYNGALIWDEGRREVVHHQPLECMRVREMIDFARARFPEVLVSCEILDRWYTDRFEQTFTTETGRLFQPDVVEPIEAFCTQPITKLLLLGNPGMIDQLGPLLAEHFPSVTLVQSDPDLIQVTDSQASKAAALRFVADHYKIPMTHVMAIGDALNDLSMLEAAGIAVAMDNAHPQVKAIADWIAPSNNDHGVHAALARYGLCR